jgi:hypothetical protein
VVECDLAKVEVAGSNPVSRSRIRRPRRARGFFAPPILEARYPSGKGEVCKTFMRGFDSHPRLQHSYTCVRSGVPHCVRDFAYGLALRSRPQNGSSSIPTRASNIQLSAFSSRLSQRKTYPRVISVTANCSIGATH